MQRHHWQRTTEAASVVLLALFTSSICVTTAKAGTLSLNSYPKVSQRVTESVVRITITPEDAKGRPIDGASKSGFGVRITKTGLILTAAHVCFPYQDEISGWDTYFVEVDHWNYDTELWERGFAYNSSSIRTNAYTLTSSLSIASKLPCLRFDSKQLIPRADDFALLRTPSSFTGKPFVDVVGLFGPLDAQSRRQQNLELFCTSDFSRRKDATLSHQGLDPGSPKWNHELQASSGIDFKGGNSGSPVLVFSPSENPSAFVAGILVRSFQEPDAKHNCSVILVKEILNQLPHDVLVSYAPPTTNHQCAWPNTDNSLLQDYLLGATSQTIEPRKRIASCFYSIPTWKETGGALEAIDAFSPLIRSKVHSLSDLTMDIHKYRSQKAVVSQMLWASATFKRNGGGLVVASTQDDETTDTIRSKTKAIDANLKKALAKHEEVLTEIKSKALQYLDKDLGLESSSPRRSGALELLDKLLLPYTEYSSNDLDALSDSPTPTK